MGATFLRIIKQYQTCIQGSNSVCLSSHPGSPPHHSTMRSGIPTRTGVPPSPGCSSSLAAGAPRLRRTSKLTASGAAWLQLTAKSRGISRCGTSVASAPALPIGEAAGLSSSTNDLAIDARHRRGVNLPTSIQHVMLAIKNRHVAASMRSSARRKIIVRMLLFREAIR